MLGLLNTTRASPQPHANVSSSSVGGGMYQQHHLPLSELSPNHQPQTNGGGGAPKVRRQQLDFDRDMLGADSSDMTQNDGDDDDEEPSQPDQRVESYDSLNNAIHAGRVTQRQDWSPTSLKRRADSIVEATTALDSSVPFVPGSGTSLRRAKKALKMALDSK